MLFTEIESKLRAAYLKELKGVPDTFLAKVAFENAINRVKTEIATEVFKKEE